MRGFGTMIPMVVGGKYGQCFRCLVPTSILEFGSQEFREHGCLGLQ